ncbi:MAG: C25 family cysteine peptidase, partial [Parabacteroides gordonii]|nr:C25 family cysteine peptidase [Parabacteroides gordonii]
MKRELQTYNEPTFFRNISSMGHKSRFTLKNANSNTIVLDVTDALNPKVMEAELSGTNLSFIIPEANQLREFAVVQLDKTVPSVSAKEVQQVSNQNLHESEQVDMIIISPSAFKSEAERLQKAHEDKDGLITRVYTPEEIYNEFSSGTPDATAYRRLMKMFYDRSKNNARVPKYLLLFGDGSFDNRFKTKDWKGVGENERKNMLLTYQTTESLDMYSYPTDDYFGFLEDDSKKVIYNYDSNNDEFPTSTATLKIGIGRFPFRTRQQAIHVV